MSAFVVGHDHIDALLTFAVAKNISYRNGDAVIHVSAANATKLGQILLQENERSVKHRYPDCAESELPGTIDETSASYVFRPWSAELNPLAVLKACDCFDYQACETDDYHTTEACRIIEGIRRITPIHLKGYYEAPGWDMRR